jgi:cation-transporting ATPase E
LIFYKEKGVLNLADRGKYNFNKSIAKRRIRDERSRANASRSVSRSAVSSENAVRFDTDRINGLTSSQVEQRKRQGYVNISSSVKTKTEKQIIIDNTFTFFNTINLILAIFVLLVGSPKNTLFMVIIFANAIIGSFQEIRSKKIIDKLSLISAPKATVIRDGMRMTVPVDEVVLDDLIALSNGNQISTDSIILDGSIEVNESMITGESDAIQKNPGDSILSGSFVVSGECTARVEHVGAENYANRIAADAKYLKKPNSEIVRSLNMIVKCVGFGILPVGAALFVKQYYFLNDTLSNSVCSTVAALIGMIPEGLVLLTSIVFAVSAIRLAQHNTLVQEMYCIETLARVDVLCLDKTGTITEGAMDVNSRIPLGKHKDEEMDAPLSAIVASLKDDNPTFKALKEKYSSPTDWKATVTVPFSSSRKWSGTQFEGKGTYVIGAGEFILGDKFESIRAEVESRSAQGYRVLLLAHSDKGFGPDNTLTGEMDCIGLIFITDRIRTEAPRTLRYFADQGVDLKVISGDNAVTVSNIAKRAGLETAENYVDATTLTSDEMINDAAQRYTVFGRVTPQQKLKLVKALKKAGHTVAMTGDGVNDVLALKESDCSIAMASGSDAARTVSNLVLMDSNFASMPLVLEEGRRSINNLQRSAALFLTKTIYSIFIGIFFIFVNVTYPFVPIQISLISTITIGIPSFVLALEPNKSLVKGKFMINVLNQSIPAALTTIFNIVILVMFCNTGFLSSSEMSTLTVIMTTITGLFLLFKISYPFNIMRTFLFAAMSLSFVVCAIFWGSFFSIVSMSLSMFIVMAPLLIFTAFSIMALTNFVDNVISLPDNFGRKKKKARKH